MQNIEYLTVQQKLATETAKLNTYQVDSNGWSNDPMTTHPWVNIHITPEPDPEEPVEGDTPSPPTVR